MPKHASLKTALQVKPGSRPRLSEIDPAATHGHDKAEAAPITERDLERLTELRPGCGPRTGSAC